jgi:hypothetical protein
MSTQPAPASDAFPFARGFGFVFEDPDWIKKILIGGVFAFLSSLLIGAFFVGGYALRVIQRTARAEPLPLPDWDDLGGIFVDGVKVVGLSLVYSLVLALVISCPVGVMAGLGVMLGESDSGAAGAAITITMLVFYAFVTLLSLLLAVYLPAALLRMALTGRFGAGFELTTNLSLIGRNLVSYLLAIALYVLTSILAQFGLLLLCIGVFPASFWSYCVGAWALGEVARRDPAYR